MAKKPTIHNPTHFEPSDYEVYDYLDNKRPEYLLGMDIKTYAAIVKDWEVDMQRILGDDWRPKSHRCIHCGNSRVRYITAVKHKPTGEMVVFGADCTERLGFENRDAWKLAELKSKAAAGHKRIKIYRARQAYLETHPEILAAIEQAKDDVHADNWFVKDVLGKLNQYGYLSDRQAAAVIKSLAKDIEHQKRKAEEDERKRPIPKELADGRSHFSGIIITTRIDQGYAYNSTVTKMLFEDDRGFRLWGSMPAAIDRAGADKGDRVSFDAAVMISDNDNTFGFFKRPTKAAVEETS